MKNFYSATSILLLWFVSFSSLWGQNEVTYGFIQDPNDPLDITAVAYPTFTSNNVTISTAVFTFYLPTGTVVDPSIPILPGSGSFTNITGSWTAQLLTEGLFDGFAMTTGGLLGNDVYQVVLQNSPSPNATAGTPIELFSFRLPSDCMDGDVEVLTNDDAIQQAVFATFFSNFNNQMSISVDDAPAIDIYADNNPSTFSLPCALDDAPDVMADDITVDENTPVNIPMLDNDDFGNNGPQVGPVVITVAATNGTAVVNDGGTPDDPTDDTIDYTPNPGFSGMDMITYQICDSDGDCETGVVTVTVLDALLGVAKAASTPVDNGDGTFTTTITLNLENLGETVLGDVQTTDDLSAFGVVGDLDMAGEYAVTNLMITSNSADALSVNADFDGAADTELLDVPAGGTLAVGETVTFSFDLTFFPGDADYTNVAVATADVPANDDPTGMEDDDPADTTDNSTNGTDPDPNGDDDPEEEDPTPIDPDDTPTAEDDSVTSDENTPVNVMVLTNDDFGSDGPSTGTITITVPADNGTAVVNDGGTPDDPTDDTIDYTPNAGFSGTDMVTYQICDSDGDCETGVVTVTVLDALLGVAKAASTPVDNGDGTFTTTITLNLENLGETVLGDVQTTDDLSAFGVVGDLDMAGEYAVTNLMITSNSADALSVNADFDGAADTELLDVPAGGTLAVGETVTFSFDLTFFPGDADYTNVAVATADVPANDDPTGMEDDDPADTTDNSTNGTDPDPNGDDDPEEEDPTPIDPDDTPTAEDDSVTSDENTPVNVMVLTNDDFGSDGPSTGTITITVPADNGTAVVNDGGTPDDPTDDTIDYTPNAGFSGTDMVTYQICDSDGDCETGVVTVTVLDALLGVAKAASTPVDNGDGTFTTTITLNLENLGETVLGDVQTTDDLSAFGVVGDLDMAGEYAVTNLMITSNSADALSVNADFDGAADTELLDVPAGGTLAVGETVTFSFDLTFFPGDADYTNVAVATADVPANDDPTGMEDDDPADTTDNSTNGTDPDPNGDDDPEEEDPTPIDPDDAPTAEDDSVTSDENTPVTVMVLTNDDFGSDGPNMGSIAITVAPMNGTAVVNDGGTPTDPTDDTITYTPDAGFSGTDMVTYQICDSDGDCETGVVTVTVLDALLGVAKAASTPVDNGDGTFTTTITLNLENLGETVLGDVQTTDDLSAFGVVGDLDMAGEYAVTNLMITSNSADALSVNADFDGAADTELLDVPAGGTLAVGETVTFSFDLTFFPGDADYTNVAVATADVPANDDPTGMEDDDPADTTDNSTNGTDPDPNGDDDPEEEDPTPINPNEVPVAENDNETTDENTLVNVMVLINDDFGLDGPSTGTITVTVAAMNGTAVVNDGGTPDDPTDDTFDYTPNAGFSGVDMFTYQICDSDGDCDDAVVTITVLDALLGVAKAASTPVDNGDGTFTTTITLNVENLGEISLGDVQTTDDLSAFGVVGDLDMAGEYAVTNLMITSNSADALSVNADFDGAADTELLDVPAGGTLAVGETVTFSFDLTFFPGDADYTNVAVATADVPANDDPTGMEDDDPADTTDNSTNGTDPDPNGDDDPEEEDPTPIDPDDAPVAEDDDVTLDQDESLNIDPLDNDDFGVDGPSMGTITITVPPTNGTAVVNDGGTPDDPTDDTIDYTPTPGFSGTDMITYQICDSDGDCNTGTISISVEATSVKLLVRVLLQGALLDSPDGLMRDDIRAAGFLPASEPYGALTAFTHVNNATNEVIGDPATIFAAAGQNSIVDWVFVELRNPLDPTEVVATRSGLVQKDGDVVDLDGVSPLCFEQSLPGMYSVAVRHRNHLGTMTGDAITLTASGTMVDFTDTGIDLWENSPSFDGVEQKEVNGQFALWAGNTNVDAAVIFAGQENDKDPIFNQIDQAPGNILRLQTFVLPGYFTSDVNMDSNSIFAGQQNDVDPIFNNVDGHPRNIIRLQTFVIPEQLAE